METKTQSPQKREKFSLLWQFLKGAKRYFLVTVAAAGVTALADMLQPQIIRAAVDCALGGKEGDFPPFVMKLVDSIGGFPYLGQHLWIMAAAILVVAIFQVLSQYAFRVYNTKASETLVKSMRDQLFSHIQRLPFSWHMKNKTGDIIQRCTSDIDTTKNFLTEAHPKLRPVESPTAGVFLSGVCQGPKDIPETVAQAGAAASKVIGLLAKNKLKTNPCTAKSDELLCNGCSTCANVCPYGAITYETKLINDHGIREDRRVAVVNSALCQGCGACTVACPSGAMDLQGFSNRQILAEVDAICR
jgi:ferredoxin